MSKIFGNKVYPELVKARGLSNALNFEFAKINSAFRVSTDVNANLPVSYARVENDNKFSQIYIGADEKLYLTDFWRDGVCLAHAHTGSISELVNVVNFWLSQNSSTSMLAEKYRFVQPNEKAKAFDENNEVEYTWNCLLNDDIFGLSEFISLASKDEILSKLFPFTSLYTLCFSRCTGYPYDSDNLPTVTPKPFGQFTTQDGKSYSSPKAGSSQNEKIFIVTQNRKEYLGEGNAAAALKLVRDNLPHNISPAIKGIASD